MSEDDGYLAHPDTPVRVDWWWTEEGRAAHDAAIRAETLRDAADGLNVAGVGFRPGWGSGNVEDLAALDALNKAVEWLRVRAAQPTEGES